MVVGYLRHPKGRRQVKRSSRPGLDELRKLAATRDKKALAFYDQYCVDGYGSHVWDSDLQAWCHPITDDSPAASVTEDAEAPVVISHGPGCCKY